MTGTLLYVAGKDPLGNDAGHSSYVRAHARAACRAGFRPLILCVGRTARVTETELGTVIRIASRVRPIRNLTMPAVGPICAAAVRRLGRERPGPLLAHGFAVWTYSAVQGCRALRAEGRRATAIMSAYATHRAESGSQVPGAGDEPLAARLSYRAQAIWGRTVIPRYERVALRGAAAVYANYDSVRGLIHSHYGSDISVQLIPYTSESAFLEPPARRQPQPPEVASLEPRDAPLVVSLSSHNGRKGVDVLIDALAEARDGGTTLRACLLGAGRLLEPHRERIAARRLERSVIAPGWVADQAPYLEAADIFALPSRAEQSGSMAMLEALQGGTVVVASDVDGIPEDISHGQDGLLVRPGDPGSLAAALTRLGRDPAERARIGAAGRATFESRFSASALTAALTRIYETAYEP